ncbi:MAG TPA: type II toxin-antitoxin system RelE/ParE family toxin [Candidatus Hydrogenedentes bacterium]|nr:type II toxin-antitoxin system RelE/ParE family toxin [Candidatus Hydrogenedentota bacterium]
MKIAFASSFERDLRKLTESAVRVAVRQAIARVEAAKDPGEIVGLRKLRTGKAYYRLRVGDYRLGMIIRSSDVTFVRFLHRSEVYRYFP